MAEITEQVKIINPKYVLNTDYLEINSDILICELCSNIYNEPLMCNDCNNFYCTNCIINYSRSRKSEVLICPSENKKTTLMKDPILHRILSVLTLTCQKGCKKVLFYHQYLKHVNLCNGHGVECYNCQCHRNKLIMEDIIEKEESIKKYREEIDIMQVKLDESKLAALDLSISTENKKAVIELLKIRNQEIENEKLNKTKTNVEPKKRMKKK